jgi:hypothetical protein
VLALVGGAGCAESVASAGNVVCRYYARLTPSSPLPSGPQAIGQRNLVEAEREARSRKVREVQAQIGERAAELARLNAEFDSLARIEQEQREMLDRLSNNEPGGV